MRDFDINTIDPLSLPARSYADRRYLPALSAVYFVIASRDIVYIGQSRNLFKRWRGHPIATRMGDVDFSVAYMEIREADLIMIEAALIERFKPHLNLNRGPYLINDEP
jgi:excinuclease UvrABC nuclease subunit